MAQTEPILVAGGIGKTFGGLVALEDYSLALHPGELVGLIGPNGAGKTTAFNIMTGVLAPSRGRLTVGGADMTGRPPHRFAGRGIARTFQTVRLFSDLSVLENVMAGLHMRHGSGVVATLLSLPGFRRAERDIAAKAREIVELLGLGHLGDARAGDLSYGDQRRVEIARAMATEPRALLLDEPAAGMNARETEDLLRLIARINDDLGIAVLVVEHDMSLVMRLCRRIQVLDRGRFLAEGTAEEVQANQDVIAAYLGTHRSGGARAQH